MGKYERPVYQKLPDRPPVAANEGPSAYEAMKLTKGGKRSGSIRVIDGEGVSYAFAAHQVVEWIFTPPKMLTLTTSARMFMIEGKNIERVIDALCDGRVSILRQFISTKHKMPAEAEEVVISQIEVQVPN